MRGDIEVRLLSLDKNGLQILDGSQFWQDPVEQSHKIYACYLADSRMQVSFRFCTRIISYNSCSQSKHQIISNLLFFPIIYLDESGLVFLLFCSQML